MKWVTSTTYNIPIKYERQTNKKRKVKELQADNGRVTYTYYEGS